MIGMRSEWGAKLSATMFETMTKHLLRLDCDCSLKKLKLGSRLLNMMWVTCTQRSCIYSMLWFYAVLLKQSAVYVNYTSKDNDRYKLDLLFSELNKDSKLRFCKISAIILFYSIIILLFLENISSICFLLIYFRKFYLIASDCDLLSRFILFSPLL